MGNLRRLEDASNRALRDCSASSAITFGTDAPFQLGAVGFTEIGFADIPAVGFVGHCKRADVPAVLAVARQHILRAVDAAGLPSAAVALCVHWGTETRERVFTDANPSSASHGKRKRGAVVRFHLELREAHRREFRAALQKVYL